MLVPSLIFWLALAPPQPRVERELTEAAGLLAKGSVAEAITLLRGTVKVHPRNAQAHLLLGSALALAPRREEAIQELTRAVELQPDSATTHNTLGTALARFAEFDRARKAFETATRLDPKWVDPHLNLALVLAQNNEIVAAGDEVARAAALCGICPQAAYLQYVQGKLYDKQNRTEQAVTAFESAIRLRPDFPDAYLELSTVKLKMGDEEKAVQALETAVRLAPRNGEARYRLGAEYLKRNNAAGAVEQLREAYRLLPEDRGILYNLARALRASGQPGDADTILRKLSEQLQSSTQASEQMFTTGKLNVEGMNLEKSGHYADAVDKYRAVLRIDPLAGPVRRNLGLALCRMGRWEEGIAELRETLRLYPEDAETTRALYIALDQAAAAGR